MIYYPSRYCDRYASKLAPAEDNFKSQDEARAFDRQHALSGLLALDEDHWNVAFTLGNARLSARLRLLADEIDEAELEACPADRPTGSA